MTVGKRKPAVLEYKNPAVPGQGPPSRASVLHDPCSPCPPPSVPHPLSSTLPHTRCSSLHFTRRTVQFTVLALYPNFPSSSPMLVLTSTLSLPTSILTSSAHLRPSCSLRCHKLSPTFLSSFRLLCIPPSSHSPIICLRPHTGY